MPDVDKSNNYLNLLYFAKEAREKTTTWIVNSWALVLILYIAMTPKADPQEEVIASHGTKSYDGLHPVVGAFD